MNSDLIVAALGEPFESAAVQAICTAVGASGEPKAKPDDPVAHLTAKAAGVELMFVDADYIAGRDVARYGNAPMLLAAGTLYSGKQKQDPTFKAFAGDIEGGLRFEEPIESALAKIGPPTSTKAIRDTLVTRSWDRADHRLTFKYARTGELEYISFVWRGYSDRVRNG